MGSCGIVGTWRVAFRGSRISCTWRAAIRESIRTFAVKNVEFVSYALCGISTCSDLCFVMSILLYWFNALKPGEKSSCKNMPDMWPCFRVTAYFTTPDVTWINDFLAIELLLVFRWPYFLTSSLAGSQSIRLLVMGAFKISPLWNVSRQCVEIRRQPDDQSCRQIRVSCSNKFDDLPCDAFTLLAKLDLVTWSNFSEGSYATIATQSKLLLENEGHTAIRLREIFFLV